MLQHLAALTSAPSSKLLETKGLPVFKSSDGHMVCLACLGHVSQHNLAKSLGRPVNQT